MLKNKTRILVTHDIEMLSKVDRIIVMEEGNIIIQGHYNELKHLTYFEKFRNNKEEHSLAKIKKINDLQETASDTSNAQKVTKSSSFVKDESQEEISISAKSFLNFFMYNKWSILILIAILLLYFVQKQ